MSDAWNEFTTSVWETVARQKSSGAPPHAVDAISAAKAAGVLSEDVAKLAGKLAPLQETLVDDPTVNIGAKEAGRFVTVLARIDELLPSMQDVRNASA